VATGALSPVIAEEALDTIVVQGQEATDPDYDAQNDTFVKDKVLGGQDLLTLPSNVNIVNRERFNLDTVNYTEETDNLLRRVPGAVSGSRNVRIPCGWCDYTVNLQNGLGTNAIGRGNYNFDGANNYDIERIEIIKGPASALYPSHAFGGVINVITKQPPETPEASLFGDVGSWGRKRAGFSLGGSENGFGLTLNGFTYELDGWGEGRAENKSSLSGRLTYDLSNMTSIQFGGTATHDYQQTTKDLTQTQWDEDWGQTTGVTVSRLDKKMGDFIIDHKFSNTFKAQLAYGYVFEESTGRFSNNEDTRHDLKPRITKDFAFWDSQLITGVDFTKGESITVNSSETTTDIISPYAQYAFSPFAGIGVLDGLKFTPGVRYESYSYDYEKNTSSVSISGENEVQALTPHLGVSYKLNSNNSIWANYSEGISVPGASDLFPDPEDRNGNTYLDNPDLQHEEATNWEIGLRGNIWDGKLAYDVSWHDTDISNFVMEQKVGTNSSGNDIYQNQNIGNVRLRGLETEVTFWPVEWTGIEVAYAYSINKFTDYILADGTDYSGNFMRRTAKHRLNTRFIVKPIENAKVELEWDHMSPTYINYDNTQTYQRPDLLHLSASYTWKDMITAWGQVRNLADVKYADRVSAGDGATGTRKYEVGTPRSWAFGLSGKLKF
jgi:outer membrane receptor protein involved in Fe transport